MESPLVSDARSHMTIFLDGKGIDTLASPNGWRSICLNIYDQDFEDVDMWQFMQWCL